MKNIYIITAFDEYNGIGKNNELPWKISGDLKHFQKTTSKCLDGKRNAVIMGRRTFESIGNRPLKNRLNIILSSNLILPENQNIKVVRCLEEGIDICEKDYYIQDIYIIGGQQVYEKAINEVKLTGIYITQIKGVYNCDCFFPTLEGFQKIYESEDQIENTIHFTYQYWIKANCE